MIYGDLIEQYKNLDESEAHALLIYKSRLSRARKKLESIFLDENTRKEDLNG